MLPRHPVARPLLMGIVNATPDSFFDGGRHDSPIAALAFAEGLLAEGADILDVGGESTRPGAAAVSAEEQIRRVGPLLAGLAALRARTPGASWLVSIDTTRSAVAAAALDLGATIVNDVSAGRDDPAIVTLAARRGAALILMHRRLAPDREHYSDRYPVPPPAGDVMEEVAAFLRERVAMANAAGIPPERLAIDPGLGFGKSVEQNLALLDGTDALRAVHPTVLVGASRKSFLGAISAAADPAGRLAPSLAAAVVATLRGAAILRVHDVGATRQAVEVACRMRQESRSRI